MLPQHQIDVSVVIPAFNAARTIAGAVMSAARQSVSPVEIIVVDDGSTDGTLAVLASLATEITTLRTIHQSRNGPSAARNTGVNESKGSYIAFLDADDSWTENHLELHGKHFHGQPEIGVSFSRCRFVTSLGVLTSTLSSRVASKVIANDLLYRNPTTTCSALVVRRQAWLDAGAMLVDLRFAEDQEWLFRMSKSKWLIMGLDTPTVYYRLNDDGLSSQTERMMQGWHLFIKCARKCDPALVQSHYQTALSEMELYCCRQAWRTRFRPIMATRHLLRSLFANPATLFKKLWGGLRLPVEQEEETHQSGHPCIALDVAFDAPLVSVVVPLFNCEPYVAKALQSIQGQSYTKFEVLVINDGSTDQCAEIAESYSKNDIRFRVVNQANRGLAGARNSGIQHARGKYIAFLDADDVWHPEKLSRHVEHLETNSWVGVSYSGSQFIAQNGSLLKACQSPKLRNVEASDILCRNPIGNGSAPVLRRVTLDEVEFQIVENGCLRTCWFDETFRQSEDIELWARIACLTTWKFEGLAEKLTFYRVNFQGLSANTQAQLVSWYRFRSKLELFDPVLVARFGGRAEAYQLRYLARRSAMNGKGRTAFAMVSQASWVCPKIWIEEPVRTFQTLALSMAAVALKPAWFDRLLSVALTSRQPT